MDPLKFLAKLRTKGVVRAEFWPDGALKAVEFGSAPVRSKAVEDIEQPEDLSGKPGGFYEEWARAQDAKAREREQAMPRRPET